MRAWLIAAFLVAGCHDGARLSQEVSTICRTQAYPGLNPTQLVPANLDTKAVSPRIVLVVDETELRMGRFSSGLEKLDPEQLKKHLKEHYSHVLDELRAQRGDPSLVQVALAIQPKAPATVLAQLVPMLSQLGFKRIVLLARSTQDPPPLPPPQQKLQRELQLRTQDPAMRSMLLAQTIDDAITFCPDLSTMVRAIASADVTQRCPLIARGMAEARLAYCIVDMDTFMAAIGLLLGSRVAITHRVYTIDPKATPMSLAPAATWQQVSPQVLGAQSDRLWFRVSGPEPAPGNPPLTAPL